MIWVKEMSISSINNFILIIVNQFFAHKHRHYFCFYLEKREFDGRYENQSRADKKRLLDCRVALAKYYLNKNQPQIDGQIDRIVFMAT